MRVPPEKLIKRLGYEVPLFMILTLSLRLDGSSPFIIPSAGTIAAIGSQQWGNTIFDFVDAR